MDREALRAAAELAKTLEEVFVATADQEGRPHVGVARRLALLPEDRVAVAEWFCPGTLANIDKHPDVALVIWDRAADAGFQLVGKVESVETLATMDGYDERAEPPRPMPQVKRQLVIRVDKILDFTRAPHTDIEE